MNLAPIKKTFFSLLLIGLGVGALSYIFIYHVKDRGVSAKDGWLFDIDGYYGAIRESKLSQRPVFLYLRRKACQRCLAFEQYYLNNPELKRVLADYVKVQILTDTDRRHRLFAERFKLNTYPSAFILFDDEHPVSLYLVLAMQQIWVAQDNINSGNFMPLSEASFRLSLSHATILAQEAALRDKSTVESIP
ncbi:MULTISPECIES: thioredoxin family protein [unclassified Agarivorans]|uniref:thioredoxin family protein n=1 Tax=unclassified Agarivorans TaxID=2636026 RepID=UPI003D7EBF4C